MKKSTPYYLGGAAALAGAGVWFFGFHVPNRPGYIKLGLNPAQWGASACQIRNPDLYFSKIPSSSQTGTLYLGLGPALTATGKQFVSTGTEDAGKALYGVAKYTRSQASQSWVLVQKFLQPTAVEAGSVTYN